MRLVDVLDSKSNVFGEFYLLNKARDQLLVTKGELPSEFIDDMTG